MANPNQGLGVSAAAVAAAPRRFPNRFVTVFVYLNPNPNPNPNLPPTPNPTLAPALTPTLPSSGVRLPERRGARRAHPMAVDSRGPAVLLPTRGTA